MKHPLIVIHAGPASAQDDSDACEDAAQAAVSAMRGGEGALDAVVAALTTLELGGRFNAGRGGAADRDGTPMPCDAAAMDSLGRLGAVAGVRRVARVAALARTVAHTPHHLLVGIGATDFAARLDMCEDWPAPRRGHDPRGAIAAVARDGEGHFAVAVSAAARTDALAGRVSEAAVIGCGFHAGPMGAMACSGDGEAIIRLALAEQVYHWVERNMPLRQAMLQAMNLMPPQAGIVIAGVTHDDAHIASRAPLASAMRSMP